MEKGRRKKVAVGMMLVLFSTFLFVQSGWAFDPTMNEPTIMPPTDTTDPMIDLGKRNNTPKVGTSLIQLEPVVTPLTDAGQDLRVTTIITLLGRFIHGVFTVYQQIARTIQDDLVANTRTLSDQTTYFGLDALGRMISAGAYGTSDTVDAKGIRGDSEIDKNAANVVTHSESYTQFRVIFGSPVATTIRQNSDTVDKLGKNHQTSYQTIAYDVDADGRYLGGTGTITGFSNNLNDARVYNPEDGTFTVDETKFVDGDQVVSQTTGVIRFTRATAANRAVASDTETLTLTYTADNVEGGGGPGTGVTITAQDGHTDFDAFGNMVRDGNGNPSTSANTYSLTVDSNLGSFNISDLTQRLQNEDSPDLLKGTVVLKAIAEASGTAKDDLVKSVAGNSNDLYTVSTGHVTFGGMSRTGNPLAVRQEQESVTRDTSDAGRSQTNSSSVINIAYAGDNSGRIVSQTGSGGSRTVQLNADLTENADLITTFGTVDMTFVIDHVNNQALLTEQVQSGWRHNEGVAGEPATDTFSSQKTTYTYGDTLDTANVLQGAQTVARSRTTALNADGTPDLEHGDHQETYTVIDYAIIGNQAHQTDSRTVTITDSHVETSGVPNQQTTGFSISHYEYAAGTGAGLIDVTNPLTKVTSEPGGPIFTFTPMSGTDLFPDALRSAYLGKYGQNMPTPAPAPLPTRAAFGR